MGKKMRDECNCRSGLDCYLKSSLKSLIFAMILAGGSIAGYCIAGKTQDTHEFESWSMVL
jgi:hypothetical protein